MPIRPALAVLLLALGVLGPAATGQADDDSPVPRASVAAAATRPNILLVMTDDMTATDLRWMPHTRRLVGRAGTTFDQGLAPNPMCCPARATVLTGQESHNNGVWSNTQPHGGYASLQPGTRLPDWLQAAGYQTAFLGKHLNGFRAEEAAGETGWDVLDALVRGVYSYRSFVTWNNGKPRAVRGGYVTDTLSDATLQVIRRFEQKDERPWFTWVAHVGPHNSRALDCSGAGRCWGPPRPAAQDRGTFSDLASPSRRDAAWNRRNGSTRPPFLRDLRRQPADVVDTLFQHRIEALQSVDRAVGAAVRELRRDDELSDTLVVFTSDNGYLLGQYRYLGKRLPYEESVRVPLLVRGPGVRAGVHTDQLTTTADLSRTIVEAAGATAPYQLDGVSLLPVLRGAGSSGRTATVLQTGAAVEYEGDRSALEEPADRGWLYRGYRDQRWTYVRYPDPSGAETPAFEELYDRRHDPHLLHNLAQDPAHADVVAEARDRAKELEACSGSACHPAWRPIRAPR